MKYTLDIDGFIGNWYNSKTNVKESLAKHKGKPVSIRINSLGGDLNHGLDICAQLEEHGDVTVDYVAFNASAATIIGLGAKHSRIHADGFYLIHKVMSWVNNWGYMNEDDIQELIDQLEKDKKENEKITLQMARKYANKTGKSVIEILNLMKEESWLSADEAKEWGFVDEVYGKSAGKVNFADMSGKFNALGLPTPARFQNTDNEGNKSLLSGIADIVDKKIESFKNEIFGRDTDDNNKPTTINMKKDWTHINSILEVEGIESKDGKVSLTEEQLELINSKIETAQAAQKDAETKLQEKETAYNTLNDEFEAFKNADGDESPQTPKTTDGGDGGAVNEGLQAYADAKKMMSILKQQ